MMTDKLKKAAILIASMDAASADALLDEMPAEEAARVRNAVMELGEIDPDEQRRVMQEFVQRNPTAMDAPDPGVELALSSQAGGPATTPAPPAPAPLVQSQSDATASAARPFQFLDHVETETLGDVLRREHPQTTAIVIAHLTASRAAEVLRRFPDELQTEVLTRIARLSPPHHEVVRDIEKEMRTLLTSRAQPQPLAAQGLATVEAILQAASDRERQGLIRNLAECDQVLARRLGGPPLPADASRAPALSPDAASHARRCPGEETTPARPLHGPLDMSGEHPTQAAAFPFRFADLEQLDDAALAEVLRAASPPTTLLALAGASHAFVQRILGQMPARDAARLEEKMRQIGPLRLSDVERAQWRLAQAAQRLIEDGLITRPASRRFAVAA